MVWYIVWLWLVHESPSTHPTISDEEKTLIQETALDLSKVRNSLFHTPVSRSRQSRPRSSTSESCNSILTHLLCISSPLSCVSGPLSCVYGLFSDISGPLSRMSGHGPLSRVSGPLSCVSGPLSCVSCPLFRVSGPLSCISGPLSCVSGPLCRRYSMREIYQSRLCPWTIIITLRKWRDTRNTQSKRNLSSKRLVFFTHLFNCLCVCLLSKDTRIAVVFLK